MICYSDFFHQLASDTQWIGWLTLSAWLTCIGFLAGRAYERDSSSSQVTRNCHALLAGRHLPPSPPPVPQRVNPQSGIIVRHWGAEEEAEALELLRQELSRARP